MCCCGVLPVTRADSGSSAATILDIRKTVHRLISQEPGMFKFTAWMFAVGAAAFFSMAVPVMADKAPDTTVEDAKDDTVVTAWKAYETAKADYDTKYKAVLKDYNDKKTTVEEARAAIAKLAEELAPTKKTFID